MRNFVPQVVNMNRNSAAVRYLGSMVIFGTIGLFVRGIPLSSGAIAMVRGFVGAAFLALVMLVRKQKPALGAVRGELWKLLLSGAMIGFNWILLFEAYRYTTVAVATLCYYLCPIFVLLASPFTSGERLTVKKTCCVLAALAGMVLVSGVLNGSVPTRGELLGVALGIGAAILYAAITIVSHSIRRTPPYEKTVVQLLTAGVVLVPYVLITGTGGTLNAPQAGLLLLVGIVHTGLAYFLYFGSLPELSIQTAAICGYIDPIVAVLLSALLLREPMTALMWVGAVLILGAAIVSELPERKK